MYYLLKRCLYIIIIAANFTSFSGLASNLYHSRITMTVPVKFNEHLCLNSLSKMSMSILWRWKGVFMCWVGFQKYVILYV